MNYTNAGLNTHILGNVFERWFSFLLICFYSDIWWLEVTIMEYWLAKFGVDTGKRIMYI